MTISYDVSSQISLMKALNKNNSSYQLRSRSVFNVRKAKLSIEPNSPIFLRAIDKITIKMEALHKIRAGPEGRGGKRTGQENKNNHLEE